MIASHIKDLMTNKSASAIRRMFEEGIALKKKFGEKNVFDFSLGNPDLDPPEEVLSAIEEVARDRSHGSHGYMPNAGYFETRTQIAKKISREQGIDVSAENIVLTAGAASALNCVLKAILSPNDEVVVPSPFFAEYRHYVKNHGGVLVEASSKSDFSLDIEKIASLLSPKTAAVIINNPNNPTGRVYSKEEIDSLSTILKVHGEKTGRFPYLICDEPYRAIVYDGAVVQSAFQFYNETVIVSSFAKDLSLPGERLGYVAIHPSCSDAATLSAAVTFCLRVLGFVNAPAFFQKVIAKSWDAKVDYSSYKKRRNLLMGILDRAGIAYARPDGAFYLFCAVPSHFSGSDSEFCEHLKKFNILAAPGTGFGGAGYFRLAYCVSEETIVNSEKAFKAAMSF